MALFAYANLRPIRLSEQIEQSDFMVFQITATDSILLSKINFSELEGIKSVKFSSQRLVIAANPLVLNEGEIDQFFKKSGIKSYTKLLKDDLADNKNHSFIKTKKAIIQMLNALRLN